MVKLVTLSGRKRVTTPREAIARENGQNFLKIEELTQIPQNSHAEIALV